ncbi:MAG: NACHT domain-containing protein, partial [Gammaproteobacteria bacterium]|nr:NACHT domain-containing protein [Gammaproteobacteria bacterium]
DSLDKVRLFSLFRRPTILSGVLKNIDWDFHPEVKLDPQFQEQDILVRRPVFSLSELCQELQHGIRLNDFSELAADDQARVLQELSELTGKESWQYDKGSFTLQLESQEVITLSCCGKDNFREVIFDLADLARIQTTPVRFLLEREGDKLPWQSLLAPATNPKTTLLSVDYGMGKTTLLKHIADEWRQGEAREDERFDWVIYVPLTELVGIIKSENLTRADIDNFLTLLRHIVCSKLLKQDLWPLQEVLVRQAISDKQLLCLLDGLDEIKGDDIGLVNGWLEFLTGHVSLIIGARPHGKNSLSIRPNMEYTLSPFNEEMLHNYVDQYFIKQAEDLHIAPDNARHKEFLQKLWQWLESDKQTALEILYRPLHAKLLCEGLEGFYQQWVNAVPDKQKEIEAIMPWHDNVFYRTKLYQMIIASQLRSYLHKHVKIGDQAYISQDHLVSMMTQTLQIRFREIAFNYLFHQSAQRLLSYLDKDQVDSELAHIGFCVKKSVVSQPGESEYEFSHRIFSEYGSALYLLCGLLQSPSSEYYKQVQDIIRTERYNPRFEQVWKILGELLRYGEPALDFKALGQDEEISGKYSAWFPGYDLAHSMDNGFYQNLQGDDASNRQLFSRDTYQLLLGHSATNSGEPEGKGGKPSGVGMAELLSFVRKSEKIYMDKNGAQNFIYEYRADIEEASDEWLLQFYLDNSEQFSAGNSGWLLQKLVLHGRWRDKGGGYWDKDVFFPLLKLLIRNRVSSVLAAYFIFRIQPRSGYFDNIGPELIEVMSELTFSRHLFNFDEESQVNCLIMSQAFLCRPELVQRIFSYNAVNLRNVIQVSWNIFLNSTNFDWVGLETLYRISVTFGLPVVIKNQLDGVYGLEIRVPYVENIPPIILKGVPRHKLQQLKQYFDALWGREQNRPYDLAWERPSVSGEFDKAELGVSSPVLPVARDGKLENQAGILLESYKQDYLPSDNSNFISALEDVGLQFAIAESLQEQADQKEQLNQRVQQYGFETTDLYNVDKDGSCFYWAVLDQIATNRGLADFVKPPVPDIAALRERVKQAFISNRLQLIQSGFFAEDAETFLANLRGRGWAGHLEILLAARMLNVNIVILPSVAAEAPVVFRVNGAEHFICLGYEVGSHYQSLRCPETGWPEQIRLLLDGRRVEGDPVPQVVMVDEILPSITAHINARSASDKSHAQDSPSSCRSSLFNTGSAAEDGPPVGTLQE